MNRLLVLAALWILSATASAMGPMTTVDYFPLVDGARYEYAFLAGARASASAVMHSGQAWAGASGLTSMHLRFVCRPDVVCNQDSVQFYRMDNDGVHHFGGNTATPDGTVHYMTAFAVPDWMLKSPVTPGAMMGPGMGYAGAESWHMSVHGMSTMAGPQNFTSSYQALGLETVVTPAGTFANAMHVLEQRGADVARHVWYAPGVGMVRWIEGDEEAVLTSATMPTAPGARVGFAVEFHHAGLDHYFVTADPDEITALDSGRFAGWLRTGMGFHVVAATDATPTAMPVCRYYGSPAYGLDTHFYSSSLDECAAVARNWPMQWTLETASAFWIYMPDPATGACPAGTQPVYRTWNRRADTNHRYTIDAMVQRMMMNRGNLPEGAGDFPVAMCSPS